MKMLAVLFAAALLIGLAAGQAFAQRGSSKGGYGGVDQGVHYDSNGKMIYPKHVSGQKKKKKSD